jgi:hypothetical protein
VGQEEKYCHLGRKVSHEASCVVAFADNLKGSSVSGEPGGRGGEECGRKKGQCRGGR